MSHEHETYYAELRRLLRSNSVKTGKTFTLASGRESDFFIDCKQSILSARGHRMAGMLLLRELRAHFPDVDAVAGVELGGCPLASAVSVLSYTDGYGTLDALYVRKAPKDHGTSALIEGSGRDAIRTREALGAFLRSRQVPSTTRPPFPMVYVCLPPWSRAAPKPREKRGHHGHREASSPGRRHRRLSGHAPEPT